MGRLLMLSLMDGVGGEDGGSVAGMAGETNEWRVLCLARRQVALTR